jgi:BON domain
VKSSSRYLVAAAAGLWMALPLPGQEPARLDAQLSPNQKLATRIADQLRQSGQLHQYNVDVSVQNGTVDLTGTVADPMQREAVLRIANTVPGVERVRDQLVLTSATDIMPAQAAVPPPPPPGIETAPMPYRVPATAAPAYPPAVGGAPGYAGTEPVPVYQGQPPGGYDTNPPAMPPNAWPTYAPYNNFSRVATPLYYPYQSWPFIGPCYPFPKVPLGWRSVKLQWEDGHWWFSKVGTSHDWWRIRYW